MKKYLLLPTYKQFLSWSLPSKIALISLWLTLLGLFISIYPYISSYFKTENNVVKNYYSIDEMRKDLKGFNSAYINLTSDLKKEIDESVKDFYRDAINGEWPFTFDISVLGDNGYGVDLNEDGIPELSVYMGFKCLGNGGCESTIYSFDMESKLLLKVGEINIWNYKISDFRENDWLMYDDFWRLGACEDIKRTYYYKDGMYTLLKEEKNYKC